MNKAFDELVQRLEDEEEDKLQRAEAVYSLWLESVKIWERAAERESKAKKGEHGAYNNAQTREALEWADAMNDAIASKLDTGNFAYLVQLIASKPEEALRAARPLIERDKRRQAGTRKKRGSKMPLLDTWLDEQLALLPSADGHTLWRAVPRSRDDFQHSGIYRDGENVVEYHDEKERETGRDGFNKRITAARGRRKTGR